MPPYLGGISFGVSLTLPHFWIYCFQMNLKRDFEMGEKAVE